ncbi:hypothetical protein Gotri_011319 [Gossypium trilobum]|uniref:Uncharacterized protein n=1 Tax=Gossypium trilobum TaxID=34281 RepID=A0A7J9ETX3_9ROSI|nr:hypothetical protein [Gossypium trilobum]
MTSHLKGVKKSTLTDEMRKSLCEYKNEHPLVKKICNNGFNKHLISLLANQQYQILLKEQLRFIIGVPFILASWKVTRKDK